MTVLLALLTLPTLSVQDPCAAEGACRHVGTLRVEGPDGRARELNINKTLPWIAQGNLMIMPGESLTIALDEKEGKLVPRLIRAGADSAATAPRDGEIRFSFGAYTKGNVMLTVESKRTDTLDYVAVMSTVSGAKRTSVCSLMPGIKMFETWQSPMHLLALSNFQPTTEPGCKTIDPARK